MKWVSIQEVAEVNPKVPKSVSEQTSASVTFLPMAAVSEEGTIDVPEEAELGDVIKGYRYFEEGDVLLAKITPCMENGKATFVEGVPHTIGFGSTEFHVLRPNTNIFGRYLFYMVWNPSFRHIAELNMTGTAGQRRVPTDFVKRYRIPLPPLTEQRRIAAILDKADAIRRKRKQAIQYTEELLRATFLDMFGDPVTNPKGWEVKLLSEVCTNFQNGIGKNKEYYGHGAKVANISDLYKWHRFSPEKYSLLDVTHQEIEKSSLKRGDLLFVRSSVKREGVAVCSTYASDEICLFSSFMIRVRPASNLINPDFLSLMLRTPSMRSKLIAASNTSTITNISQPGLSKIEVCVPPIEKQNLITKITENIESSAQRYLHVCDASEDLFNSLLQRAFRGEL